MFQLKKNNSKNNNPPNKKQQTVVFTNGIRVTFYQTPRALTIAMFIETD